MCIAMHKVLNLEKPTKHSSGKRCKSNPFGKFNSVLAVVLLLGSAFSGFCDELASMASVPLGFQISGFDKAGTLMSQNGVFAFGFFQGCPKQDDVDGFVVGIRYNLGDTKATNLPVWTVGGGLRVSMNSTIRLDMDGRLVLVENPSGLVVWTSNTSNLGVKRAALLNNGNLVLMGDGDNVLWGSFDSPTSTLLPGQSLHFGQTLRAPSTKSTTSYYSFVIRHNGELALVWENNVTYWRAHSSFSGGTVREARFDANGTLQLIDATDRAVWSTSSKDLGDPLISLRHLRMDSDGNLRIYSWDHELHQWKVGWQAVENQCDVFGSCGLYSLCGFNSSGAVCGCLYQDSVSWGSGLDTLDSGNSGCKKMVDLGNCKTKTSMIVLKQTDLYGLYPPQDVDMWLSEKSCKEYCSNDSSCIAATSKNDGSGICTIKRTGFISGYRNPSVPATSFLKVCLVPQAVSARGADPHFNPVPTLSKGSIDHAGDSKMIVGAIALIVLVTASGFLTAQMFVFWFIYRRRQIKAHTRIPFGKDAEMNAHYSALIRLSFEEMKELTANFENQLGPSVYKGVLPNKVVVVAKVMNDVAADEKEFRMAVSTLGRMHHRNLVPLKGFCFESNHRFLLYEYVQNGSLEEWLFSIKHDQHERNWQKRLEIAIGVARALAYLHSECQLCVAHGNLKLKNVLLDENWVPKLTDFGLRSLFQKEAASSSESPPERDIYMFGEMLLQIVTCKRDILSESVQHAIEEMNEKANLADNMDSEGMERAVRIALWCTQNQPFLRPSIGEVVKVLEGTLSVDRPPLTFASVYDKVDECVSTDTEVGSQKEG
ncbi:hypothetical protein Tsubulata_037698 [Turnera subulata]|uniref:Receptor-like serine/threonine-protein kinase n=1 Tax=Turnera subulata TaxID=218843 RepID=A0A9Q0FRP9_9ROSI|nr:hypothetical protein Tsubulata_037698 [Turnera subulata]